MASRSFDTRRGFEGVVSGYTVRTTEMSPHSLTTASFAVWIETDRFKPEEPQPDASNAVRLPSATADTGELVAGRLAYDAFCLETKCADARHCLLLFTAARRSSRSRGVMTPSFR
jgi:hypothetical protein